MAFSEQAKAPKFSQPVRQIFIMLVILGLVVTGAFWAFTSINKVFSASPYLNGVIVLVFIIGIIACFWQALTLVSSVRWIEGFAIDRPGHEVTSPPRILAPLAAILRKRGARLALTSSSTRSILDSVGSRLDEARDITRYIINLLIFLGLLGTFYGLATTVPAVVDTIRSLAPHEGADSMSVFDNLMGGLEDQLGGMGTAFGSSLLGLAGSLIVGLLELFAGHGQNRFYRELEEWLSSVTRISLGGEDGSPVDGAALLSLMEENAYQIETMRNMVGKSESIRASTDARVSLLIDSVEGLVGKLNTLSERQVALEERHQKTIESLLKTQQDIAKSVTRPSGASPELMEEIDQRMSILIREMGDGRSKISKELGTQIALLTDTLRRAAGMDQ